MKKRILMLDNAIDRKIYSPVLHFPPFFVHPFDVFPASENQLPIDPEPYTHILVSGSESSVLDDSDWLFAEMDLIRRAIDGGRVVLGSCFGHQLIARALFGKSSVRRMNEAEIGWFPVTVLESDPLFGDARDRIHAFCYHHDEVCELPPGRVTVLASSSVSSIHGFKLKNRPVYGVQSHPEISINQGLAIIDAVDGPDAPDKNAYLTEPQRIPKDSNWILPLMAAFQKLDPVSP